MNRFDIDFDQQMFLRYVNELHEYLFGTLEFEDLLVDVYNDHQKHHLLTLHLLTDKKVFHHYYKKMDELGLAPIFNILVGALTEDVSGNKIKEHLTSFIEITPDLKTNEPSNYDKKVLMKNLNSFMMYAKKRKGVLNSFIQRDE